MYDTTAGAVAGPILAEKKPGPAIRMFHGVLAQKDTLPGQYPEQFHLLQVGTQDEESATITTTTPEVIATGSAWKESQQKTEVVK